MRDLKEPTEILEMVRELKMAFMDAQEIEIGMMVRDIEKKYRNKINKTK